MYKKFLWVSLVVLVLGVFNSTMGEVLVQFRFDGVNGSSLPSVLTDDTANVQFNVIEEDGGTMTYDAPNPFYNTGGTSVHITPNSGLESSADGNDVLDLAIPEYTIEMYIKINSFNQSQTVLWKKYTAAYVTLEYYDDGIIHYQQGGEDPTHLVVTPEPNALQLDQWYHLAVTFDSADAVEPQKIYIDSVKVAGGGTQTLNDPCNDDMVAIGHMRRDAAHNFTGDDWMDGWIDEIRVSDKALDPSEFVMFSSTAITSARLQTPWKDSENLCPDVVLTWIPGDYAGSHDVYLGTDLDAVTNATTVSAEFRGNQEPNEYDCGTEESLVLGTTYYWRIDEVNDACGASPWTSRVWAFTLNDGKAYDIFPGEGVRIAPDVPLAWSAGCGATSHDVYVGTSFAAVSAATPGSHSGVEYANVSSPSYSPSLGTFTTYYWRVDEIGNGSGAGDVWMFRTGLGGTLMYYKFDGSVGNSIGSTITDDSGNGIVFTKYIDPVVVGSVKYGQSNPVVDASTASAEFVPGSGFYRADTGENDMLRMDGTEYTIEMWVKPEVLDDTYGDIMLIGKRNEYSWSIVINDPQEGNNRQYRWFHAGNDESMYDDSAVEGEWAHIAAVYDNNEAVGDRMKFYLNGVVEADGRESSLNPGDVNAVTIAMTEDNPSGYTGFLDGLIDELRISDVALAPCEFLLSPGPEWASCPDPYDTERDVDPNVVLSWTVGSGAVTHDVYFGTDHNDVRDATTATAGIYLGNVSGNIYPETGNLELEVETTYYWRVDEINGGTYKGVVWSFRTPSPILDENLRAWYKLDAASGKDAYDYSGYGHNADVDAGSPDWDPADGQFGGSLGLDDDTDVEMPSEVLSTLTNSITVTTWLKDADRPGTNNWVFSAGSGDAVVEAAVVGTDGSAIWRAGGDVNDVVTWDLDGQSAGDIDGWHFWAFVKDEVSGSMSIYFDGKVVESNDVVDTSTLVKVRNRQMRIGAGPGQSNTFIGRVDDFRVYDRALSTDDIVALFRGGNVELAWAPDPGDNAKNVARDAVLRWSSGDFAVQHDVYFGTDVDAVTDANTTVPLGVYKGRQAIDGNSYAPPGDLALGTTYYWRIDEVNDACAASPWAGDVWKFTVANYIIIDDFESYNDSDNIIYDTWLEDASAWLDLGYGGDPARPGGEQSMDFLYYNNVDYGGGYYSEVGKALGGMDFTQAGVKSLTVFFYGDPTNDAGSTEEPYVGIDDGSTYAESAYTDTNSVENPHLISDIQQAEWHEWNVPISDLNSATLTGIEHIYIGFGQRGGGVAGGTGEVYFDNVRLYPPKCVPELGPTYDWSGNCVVDLADVGIMADNWLRTDAVLAVQAPGTGPVGHWELDDGSGATATDSTANNNHGSLEGATSWVAGKVGSGAVEFAGNDGRIRIPHAEVLMPDNAISVTAWIYAAEAPDGYSARVLAKGIDAGDWEAYYIQFSADQQASWTIRDPNHVNHALDGSELSLNEWIHLAGTYDGDALKLYVNGQLDAEDTTGGLAMLQDSNDLSIGNRSDGNDRAFTGDIDDVRVYDYALSALEVAYVATAPAYDGYVSLNSQVNIYDGEPVGQKAVNFRDLAELMTVWLQEKLYPE